jgi:hypothetical protein
MENNQFETLVEFLKSRKVKFKDYPLFYIYLITIVIGIGGFSIWASIFIEFKNAIFLHQNVYLGLMGFSLPMTTSFAIDIIKIETEEFIKRIFQVICIAVPFILIILFIVFFNTMLGYLFSGINVLLSLFFWWVINSKNSNLCDETFYTKNRKSEQSLEQTLNSL